MGRAAPCGVSKLILVIYDAERSKAAPGLHLYGRRERREVHSERQGFQLVQPECAVPLAKLRLRLFQSRVVLYCAERLQFRVRLTQKGQSLPVLPRYRWPLIPKITSAVDRAHPPPHTGG